MTFIITTIMEISFIFNLTETAYNYNLKPKRGLGSYLIQK